MASYACERRRFRFYLKRFERKVVSELNLDQIGVLVVAGKEFKISEKEFLLHEMRVDTSRIISHFLLATKILSVHGLKALSFLLYRSGSSLSCTSFKDAFELPLLKAKIQ